MSAVIANPLKEKVDYQFRFRYETLRSLLSKNGNALQIMSDLEADLNHVHHYNYRIKRSIRKLVTEALLMAQELNLLTRDRYPELFSTIFHLRNETDALFRREELAEQKPSAIMMDYQETPDAALVGGKAAGIWQLGSHFPDTVPPGFVVTTSGYARCLEANQLYQRIRLMLTHIDVTTDEDQFQLRTRTIRKWIREMTVPDNISQAIRGYANMVMETQGQVQWAVRSSAVLEDSEYSFAGQFDSELTVAPENLIDAYKSVLASRFTDRAVRYRIHIGVREVDTPMAVLFMPMVDAAAAGMVATSDTEHRDETHMVVNAVSGLAHNMVRGEEQADTFVLKKQPHPEIVQVIPAHGDTDRGTPASGTPNEKIMEIATKALKAVEIFGYALDMEWAMEKNGAVRFLQARHLNVRPPYEETMLHLLAKKDDIPLLEGGITIFPGRAEGPVVVLDNDADMGSVPLGAIVLAEKPRPELAVILPKIAALLVMEGNPVGHLATLVREFGIPCIFKVGDHATLLKGKNIISVNATKRTVYAGIRWEGIRERGLERIRSRKKEKAVTPLSELVLRLNLLDPDASYFKPQSCKSVHDTLRFIHEMAVRSMFGFGDTHKRGLFHQSRLLNTDLPVKLHVIDLDNSTDAHQKKIVPEDIKSVPFQAFWRGMSDRRLAWPERWRREMAGMPSDFQEAVLGGSRGPRRVHDRNYAMIAADYINVNARFAYHYAMIDSMVGPGSENNHVHFRVRGGGGGKDNRFRRARFLSRVLRASGFGVEQEGDLVTAWMRRHSETESSEALTLLGRLMVCARQLDAVLRHDTDVKRFADYFLEGDYTIFT